MKKLLIIGLLLLTAFQIFANSKNDSFTPVKLLSFKLGETRQHRQYSMNNLIDFNQNIEFYQYNPNLLNVINYATATKAQNTEEENVFRRMEILFFGSLTIITFSAWFAFSIFNIIIYGESFGVIRKEQYLPMYLGSSVISLSVSISDLINNLQKKKKIKYVEFY